MKPAKNIKLTTNKIESLSVTGIHTFTFHTIDTPFAKSIMVKIDEAINSYKQARANLDIKGANFWCKNYQDFIRVLDSNCIKRQIIVKNITTNIGRNVFARILSGDTTYTGVINYIALGTNTSVATVNDTLLGAETYRKAVSVGESLNNIATVYTFFTPLEVTGTFEEYGCFIDGTGAANSGILFNRFLQNLAKSSLESLQVSTEITINNA